MIPVRAYEGQRVGVLGLGRSGLTTARALAAGGATPVCWDDGTAPRAAAEEAGWEIADLTRERESASISALIVSPGIPHLYPLPHPAVAHAFGHGIPVDNDIGLFFEALLAADERDFGDFDEGPESRVIAVTGSNGKSTTTALIQHCIATAGRHVQMGGNIGRGVLDLDPSDPGGVIVLELSSYQIELARSLAPDIAIFLNLKPDHLSRHGGIGGYFAAKRRLFEQGAPSRAIIGLDEMEGCYVANRLADAIHISVTRRLRGNGWSVFMNKRFLTEWRHGRQQAAIDLADAHGLVGGHNHQNACAAYAACRAVGLAPRQIEPGLMRFPGLAHRMERLGMVRGVLVVNDSKATNADAAEQALRAYDRIRWIAGGQPKSGGIEMLKPHFDRVRKAYLIGDAAEMFAASLGSTSHQTCNDLAGAVAAALTEAEPGDVILLSPAGASFDQYTSFEARGEEFRSLITPHLDAEDTP